jgi:hypothetical protein
MDGATQRFMAGPSATPLDVLEPSLALVLAAARFPAGPKDAAEIRRLAAAGLAVPEFFLWLVRRHRIAPLVLEGLLNAAAEIPAELLATLRTEAASAARRSLAQLAEMASLAQAFDAAGLIFVTVKGAALSILAFNDPGRRDAKDIDLVVAVADVAAAETLILKRGYRRFEPDFPLTRRQNTAFLRAGRHFAYHHPRAGHVIELHWRFSGNPFFFPLAIEAARLRRIPVGAGAVPILAPDDLFLYLCVHGAEHAWFRLKWLADVAALLRTGGAGPLDTLMRRAATLGVSRHLGQALLLAHRLLAAPVPADLLARFERDPSIANFIRVALREIRRGTPPGDPTETRSFRAWSRLHHLRLAGGGRYLMGELRTNLLRLGDWQSIRLPDALFPLYAAYRPLGWLARRGWAAMKRVGRAF